MPKTKVKTKRPTVTVTLAKFDAHGDDPAYRPIRSGVPIGDFRPLAFGDYQPRGGTPLRDATASFITHLDELRSPDTVTIGLLADESGSMSGREAGVIQGLNEFVDGMRAVAKVDPDAAGKVLAVIVTDGLENASREITSEVLRDMLRAREADGWTFIYLGANQDAWDAGTSYGLSGSASGQTVAMASSTPQAFNSALRTTGKTHGNSFLSSQADYAVAAAATSNRTIAEDGTEEALPTATPDEAVTKAVQDATSTLTGKDK